MTPKVAYVLTLALTAAGVPSLAQTQPAAPAPAQPPAALSGAPAAAQRYSIDTKFSVLYADPKAAEVVKAFFRKRRAAAGKPELTAEESARMGAMIADMSPREIAQYPQSGLDDAAMAELDALLARVPYPPAPVPTPASSPTGDPS